MSAPTVLTVASAIGFLGMMGTFVVLSVRNRRVQPGLWLSIGALSIFWMEAPYDWSMYAQFNPDFAKFPDWGPLGITYGGLPLMATIGYVMYFGVPTVMALFFAPRIAKRFTMNRPFSLLTAGLVVGFVWDGVWEILGTRVGMWRFARTAPGLVLFGGTKYQVPIYCFLAMGTLVMVATYLTGRLSDRGETIFELAARRNRSRLFSSAPAAALVGFVVTIHVTYALSMAPHLFTKVTGLQTTASSEPLFETIPLQLE